MQSLKTKRFIGDILGDIFKESISSAKKKSQKLKEADDPFGVKDEDAEKSKDASEKSSQEKDKVLDKDEAEKLKKADITVDDVIEKLNSIRSGKSYKDEEILGKLTVYVDSLGDAEKTALLAFLKALSQIVTGEVASEDVVKPSDKPVDVKMEKGEEQQKRTIKPIVIQKQAPEEDKEEKTPAEDTKGPVPIAAKKKGTT